MKKALCVLLTLLVIFSLSPLLSYAGPHGHYRGGIWIGPYWDTYPYYRYPYYTAPQVIIERPSADYYILPAPQQHEEPAYWYYCRKPEGYYPYVKQCPDGWMKVVPTPPSQTKDK